MGCFDSLRDKNRWSFQTIHGIFLKQKSDTGIADWCRNQRLRFEYKTAVGVAKQIVKGILVPHSIANEYLWFIFHVVCQHTRYGFVSWWTPCRKLHANLFFIHTKRGKFWAECERFLPLRLLWSNETFTIESETKLLKFLNDRWRESKGRFWGFYYINGWWLVSWLLFSFIFKTIFLEYSAPVTKHMQIIFITTV